MVEIMAAVDLVPLSTAAEMLDIGPEQVRRYVKRGLLPADKVGSMWLIPTAHVHGLRNGQPRRGRPLSSGAAWAAIVAGDIDLDDPWRYVNRGSIARWVGTAAMIADLLCRTDIVVGGLHAARAVHGALLDPAADEAQVYMAVQSGTDLLRGFVPSGVGDLIVRSVEPAGWERLLSAARRPSAQDALAFGSSRTLYAPAAAVALDLATSPYAREQDIAAALAGTLR